MHVRLPSTLTLLTLGPLMQLAAAAEAWHALALGGLVLAASCLKRRTPEPEPEPEPELLMNRLPTGRARPKFRGCVSHEARVRVQELVTAGSRHRWGQVEDWFQ